MIPAEGERLLFALTGTENHRCLGIGPHVLCILAGLRFQLN